MCDSEKRRRRRRKSPPKEPKKSGHRLLEDYEEMEDDEAAIVEDEESESAEQKRLRLEEQTRLVEAANRHARGTLPSDDEDDFAAAQPDNEDTGDQDDFEDRFTGATTRPTGKRRFASMLQNLRYFLAYRKSKKGWHPVHSATGLNQHYIIDNYQRVLEKRLYHMRKKFTDFETTTK